MELSISVELYRLAVTLTESPFLQMDAGYNLAQALADLAEMLEDLEVDGRADEIRRLREEARDMLEKIYQGQEEYLRSSTEVNDEEAVDEVGGAGDMEVDIPQGDKAETTTYETHLPTSSSFVDTVLALVDIHLSLWPSNPTQYAVRSILERAAPLTPPGRQAELDLAEIKLLLAMDGLVWDSSKAEARIGTMVDKSLEGAILALEALLASLEVYAPEEQTVRADILTTMADTHTAQANKMLVLSPQLPPGPSYLAQQAWFHFSQAVSHLVTALELPTTTSTPRVFKPSTLLALSRASLARGWRK